MELHSHAIFRFALKQMRNADDAKEIVQISFEKLWMKHENVDINTILYTFMYKIQLILQFKPHPLAHTGYLVSAHVKLKESRGHTTKRYDDFNLNNFILSPFLNEEYKDVGLYVRYLLTNIFKARQGANSQCLQFGIALKFT